jgi:hypothetical protein
MLPTDVAAAWVAIKVGFEETVIISFAEQISVFLLMAKEHLVRFIE